MKVHFGGHSVFLDRTGAAVIKDLGIIVLNRIAWSDSQGELFPEQSDSALIRGAIERLVGEFAPSRALILGASDVNDCAGLTGFLQDLGVEAAYIGKDGVDSYTVGALSIGTDRFASPSISGAESDEADGDVHFVLSEGRLVLPSFRPVTSEADLEPGLILVTARD